MYSVQLTQCKLDVGESTMYREQYTYVQCTTYTLYTKHKEKILFTENSKQMYSVQLKHCKKYSRRKYYVQRTVNRCKVYSLHTVY